MPETKTTVGCAYMNEGKWDADGDFALRASGSIVEQGDLLMVTIRPKTRS